MKAKNMSTHEFNEYHDRLDEIQKRQDKKKEKRHNRRKRKAKRGSTIKRNVFTFFFLPVIVVLFVLCIWFFDSNRFSFESYGGIVVSFISAGIFIGFFFSLNYFFRKKMRNRSEKRIIHKGIFFLNFFIPVIILTGLGFLFAKGLISMEYYPFNTDNVSSLVTSLEKLF